MAFSAAQEREFAQYVHPKHQPIFAMAALQFKVHILVRRTGPQSIAWIGKPGFTGKRADLKAKTADSLDGPHPVAGLVCSPFLRPSAFSPKRLATARTEWMNSAHRITVPPHGQGFDERRAPRCDTPYIVQADPGSRYFGCVALVDGGLLVPRFVHGDYDLYAIYPARDSWAEPVGQAAQVLHPLIDVPRKAPEMPKPPSALNQRVAPAQRRDLSGGMSLPTALSMQQRADLSDVNLAKRGKAGAAGSAIADAAGAGHWAPVMNLEGPLAFRVAAFINQAICATSPDLLGSLMVNHGEQVSLAGKGHSFEEVLAFAPPLPGAGAGPARMQILQDEASHEAYYRLP